MPRADQTSQADPAGATSFDHPRDLSHEENLAAALSSFLSQLNSSVAAGLDQTVDVTDSAASAERGAGPSPSGPSYQPIARSQGLKRVLPAGALESSLYGAPPPPAPHPPGPTPRLPMRKTPRSSRRPCRARSRGRPRRMAWTGPSLPPAPGRCRPVAGLRAGAGPPEPAPPGARGGPAGRYLSRAGGEKVALAQQNPPPGRGPKGAR